MSEIPMYPDECPHGASTKSMATHGHPVPWVDDLTREVRALVVKYRAKQG